MTKDELIDEMKNRISLALKDPILQQGFEIICKNLVDLEKENEELKEEMGAKQVVLNDFKSRVETVTERFNKKSSQLTKAKDIIKKLVNGIRVLDDPKVELTDCDRFLADAEQFLKEV